MEDDRFRYICSCDFEELIKLKVVSLEGLSLQPNAENLLSDLTCPMSGYGKDIYVETKLITENFTLFDLEDKDEVQKLLTCPSLFTSYKSQNHSRCSWNEWLEWPIKYCEVASDSYFQFTIYEPKLPKSSKEADCRSLIGTAKLCLFSDDGSLKKGLCDVRLSTDDYTKSQNATICKQSDTLEMDRLAALTKQHRNGEIAHLDWLDRLAFREIEYINERDKRLTGALYLVVEFPNIYDNTGNYETTLLFFENGFDPLSVQTSLSDLCPVIDYEIAMDNLLELRHHHISRSSRSEVMDRTLIPDAAIRDKLNSLLNQPSIFASPSISILTNSVNTNFRDVQDIIWKYRYYLSSHTKALPVFLRCVSWDENDECQQAIEIMHEWAPIEPFQALELLGSSFLHSSVRHYAVSRLNHCDDQELSMYLLQLVQALRYEDELCIEKCLNNQISPTNNSFATNVINRPNATIDSVCVSLDKITLQEELDGETIGHNTHLTKPHSENSISCNESNIFKQPLDLVHFLIYRASRNTGVAIHFYWYLKVECEEVENENDSGKMLSKFRSESIYPYVMKLFKKRLMNGDLKCREILNVLNGQQEFVDKFVLLFTSVNKEGGNRRKKIERLQTMLSDPEVFGYNFENFQCLPLPLDPTVDVSGIIPSKSTLFKSALMPALLHMRCVPSASELSAGKLLSVTTVADDYDRVGPTYSLIFKYGDDLRQDQLILQIVTVIDRLLQREGLDLKLTPYKVLAASNKYGFVQYVPSTPVAEVLSQYGSIQQYLRQNAPAQNTETYGIRPDVMDNYISSCAGYCVITYILGIGDRHLDNLLLTSSGNLFHVDFGYILGRDPKPLPPPMKLSKEMVEGMGGITSEHYNMFRKHCYTAFLHLRRHASVIVNLFSLMVDASIPDIALEPDKTVNKIHDKFRLDLTDEEAVRYMQTLIDESVTAVMAALVEQLHKFAQYWRR